MVIESREAKLSPGDKSDRQATWIMLAILSVCGMAALAYVYLRKPGNSSAIVFTALVTFTYAVWKTFADLRLARTAVARHAAYVEDVAAGRIVVMRCESRELVKIDGDGDGESPVYAFQAEPGQLLVVTGEVFDNARGFPSTVFEFTYAEEDEDDVLSVRAMGEPLAPRRTIPGSACEGAGNLDEYQLFKGQLGDLEQLISSPKAS